MIDKNIIVFGFGFLFIFILDLIAGLLGLLYLPKIVTLIVLPAILILHVKIFIAGINKMGNKNNE